MLLAQPCQSSIASVCYSLNSMDRIDQVLPFMSAVFMEKIGVYLTSSIIEYGSR